MSKSRNTHNAERQKNQELWLEAIRHGEFIPKISTRLCGKHFVESGYQMASVYTGK